MGVLNFIANSGTLALILAAILRYNRHQDEREWRDVRDRLEEARRRNRDN